nr:bifunctional diguanylate cyclase/phosphodiesterase [Sphingomonas sp. EC-HK361]
MGLIPPGLTAADGALELLPIPAVIVGPCDTGLFFEAHNKAFRHAGLGHSPDRSILVRQLGERLMHFLLDGATRDEFIWETGDSVEIRHYRVTIARIASRCEPRALVTLVDQTGEMRTERNLRREMLTDSLTGLANRAGFNERLEALVAGQQQPFAVLVVDLERFSRVNACLGSLAGDELLITVARRLKAALRTCDILARTGGDEFAILLAIDEDADEALRVAARLRAVLAAPFRLSETEVRISCSIGIAHGDEVQDEDVGAVIRHAQFAVNRSKKSGRDEVYQKRAFAIAREEFAVEAALRRAIDSRALRLHYQPICDLSTGRIAAFEGLARWTDECGRSHPPDEFIALAENTGLIMPLGRWAIDEVVATLARWDRRYGGDCGVKLAVNLSAIQLHRDEIAPVVAAALAAHGVDGTRLKLELTESALVTDPDRIADTLHALKALGTTLAMDDFGTGYSNLASLQKLPIDILKIDRSFVTGMLADRDKIAIVRAILSLAQTLGMTTVAEGIETQELAQTLSALGCTHGQGYVFARPLEAEEAYRLLLARNI